MAIQLQKAGIDDFKVIEKADKVGGTWRENTYPGAACDVQSHLYSLSFAPNPTWSKVFSGWREIQSYLEQVQDDFTLVDNIRFNTEMVGATFNQFLGIWQVALKGGEHMQAKHLVLGTGPLHMPKKPNIKGLESFQGEVFHSANWRHEVSLKDKNVISIGTGGSAVQYVPEVAKQAKKLTVFQRNAAWLMPRNERAYTGLEKWLFKRVPLWRKSYRAYLYFANEARFIPMKYPILAKLAQGISRWHLYRQVKDPALRKQLTPNYTMGCKRILISNQYFPAFNRSNVALNTSGVAQVNAHGVTDKQGNEVPADVIILGTGFEADPKVFLKDIPIRGLNGERLLNTWQQNGAQAYLGVSVAGFPNFYQMVGPNTGLGHNTVVFMIECQARYIISAIKALANRKAGYLNVKPERQKEYNQQLQKKLSTMVWQTGCNSWYQDKDGHNFTIWPGSTLSYYWQTKKLLVQNYQWHDVEEQLSSIKIPVQN
jgi:cation diffusion facilitator CzcD-associated flavoprotein CzcO